VPLRAAVDMVKGAVEELSRASGTGGDPMRSRSRPLEQVAKRICHRLADRSRREGQLANI
jgi:hypothetical protein